MVVMLTVVLVLHSKKIGPIQSLTNTKHIHVFDGYSLDKIFGLAYM